VTRAEVSPAGDRVVYAVDSTSLHSVPVGGGPSVTLSVPLTDGQRLSFEHFTPSGDRVVYNVVDEQFEGIALYAVAIGGGPSQDLGSSASFVTQLSDEVVVYLAGTDGRRQVVAAVLAGGEPRVLNDELGPDGGALVDGDGFGDGFLRTDHVWYLADRDVDEVFEIYSVRVGLRCEGELATILGTAGNDSLIGTSARDVIVAGRGDDTVSARRGADLICAGTGADSVAAGGGDDIVRGEAGSDEISGGGGADTIVGGAAADELMGGGGADTILGGRGPDSLDGGRGNDTLDGGARRDTCAGGAGPADVASNCELTTGVP
jgi:Ca2+-binding RTX toxin-like protein